MAPYIEFKSVLKKVNLKPNGTKEIVLEVAGSDLDNQLNDLALMIGTHIETSVENQKVRYNVLYNDMLDEPVKKYRVDETTGVVYEIEPEPDQMELDMGLPPEQFPTRLEEKEIDADVVDEFIASGLAPDYEDEFGYDMADIIHRYIDGESYLKLATEFEMSSGKIAQLVDQYREKVAPLAAKWHEWKRLNTMMEKPKDQEPIAEDTEVEFETEDAAAEEQPDEKDNGAA